MQDEEFKAAEAWMRQFQDMAFDVEALVDPARAAGRVGRAMRRLLKPLPFDDAPGRYTDALESFAPAAVAKDRDDG